MRSTLLHSLAALFTAATQGAVGANDAPRTPIAPNHEAVAANAHRIFNALHSAGRQWGSSILHNGYGFFPAVMPKGTVTYHGTVNQTEPPTVPEWLAFEPEHAENFAVSFQGRRPRHPPSPPPDSGTGTEAEANAGSDADAPIRAGSSGFAEQQPLARPGDDEEIILVGYLHTYRANRDLQLLYIDGLSAAKSDLGTLDSQDLVLRHNETRDGSILDDRTRARDICDLIGPWGYDGFVRTEIGFEVVYCDFSNGLDLLSATRTLLIDDKIGDFRSTYVFSWARAVAERYDGLGDRLRVDFSSMVSGFFFPINISSTRADRPDLIRLGAVPLDELSDIAAYLRAVSHRPRSFTAPWQGVVDLILSRFANRLDLMRREQTPSSHFINDLESATLTYFDAPSFVDDAPSTSDYSQGGPNKTEDAIYRCVQYHLIAALAHEHEWTPEDRLIHTAVKSVLSYICFNFFYMRSLLLEASQDPAASSYRINQGADGEDMEEALSAAKNITRSMVDTLGWPIWKKTRPCAPDQVMFVAMWPFGSPDDHWNPGCRTKEHLNGHPGSYWF